MVGWLGRIFGRKAVAEAPPLVAAPAAPAPAAVAVASPAPAAVPAAAPAPALAPKPAPPPYVPNLPNAAGLASKALSEHSRPLPVPAPPAPEPAVPATPVLGADEKLVLLQVARGSSRRARPAVAAALHGITGDRPNLNRVPNRAQVARALYRLGRDPAKVAALLEQVEVLAGVARRR